jgi:hypothetical protein
MGTLRAFRRSYGSDEFLFPAWALVALLSLFWIRSLRSTQRSSQRV